MTAEQKFMVPLAVGHRDCARPPMSVKVPVLAVLLGVALLAGHPARGQSVPRQRPGRVLIIRGTMTIFSLGMDTLADQLGKHGLQVEVVPAFMASSAAARIGEEYARRADFGPIVIIGHSRGGHLGPQCARQLQERRIPVKLVVIVDNPNHTVVPANVERCVNFYHTNMFGVFHGLPVQAEDRRTRLLNVDIDRLPDRQREGYIDHFNMDASPWIHSMIVEEVVRACSALSGMPQELSHPELMRLSDRSQALNGDYLKFRQGPMKVRR